MQGNHGKVWWCTPLSPAHGRLRQEDHKFRVDLGCIAICRLSLGYIVGVCLRTNREVRPELSELVPERNTQGNYMNKCPILKLDNLRILRNLVTNLNSSVVFLKH